MVEKRVDDMEEYRDYPISCVVPIDIDGITCITGRPLCDTKKLEPGTIDRENEKSKMNKSALVVEGGGMRGVFSAGVLHAFGEIGFNPFDLYIGVSAGACNLASHLAGQNDRNFDIIMRYSSTELS